MPLGRTGDIHARNLLASNVKTSTLSSSGPVVPTYTAAEIANLPSAVDGTIVYDSSNQQFFGLANAVWVAMS